MKEGLRACREKQSLLREQRAFLQLELAGPEEDTEKIRLETGLDQGELRKLC